MLDSVLVETTIFYMSTRHDPPQVLHEAAAAYKIAEQFQVVGHCFG